MSRDPDLSMNKSRKTTPFVASGGQIRVIIEATPRGEIFAGKFA